MIDQQEPVAVEEGSPTLFSNFTFLNEHAESFMQAYSEAYAVPLETIPSETFKQVEDAQSRHRLGEQQQVKLKEKIKPGEYSFENGRIIFHSESSLNMVAEVNVGWLRQALSSEKENTLPFQTKTLFVIMQEMAQFSGLDGEIEDIENNISSIEENLDSLIEQFTHFVPFLIHLNSELKALGPLYPIFKKRYDQMAAYRARLSAEAKDIMMNDEQLSLLNAELKEVSVEYQAGKRTPSEIRRDINKRLDQLQPNRIYAENFMDYFEQLQQHLSSLNMFVEIAKRVFETQELKQFLESTPIEGQTLDPEGMAFFIQQIGVNVTTLLEENT